MYGLIIEYAEELESHDLARFERKLSEIGLIRHLTGLYIGRSKPNSIKIFTTLQNIFKQTPGWRTMIHKITMLDISDIDEIRI